MIVSGSDAGEGEGAENGLPSTGGESGIRSDSLGLGYTVRGSRIFVHYPVRESGPEGTTGFGHGFDIGPIPESYWTDAPNEITRERVAIWRALLEGTPAIGPDVGDGR